MAVFLVLPLAAALAVYFNKKFGETLLVAITGMTVCVYISGLFGFFIPGVVLAVLMSAVSCIYLAVRTVKDRSAVRNAVLTAGFIAALILLVFFMISDLGRALGDASDDYGHWALAVKNFYTYSRFSNLAPSTDKYGYYPPILTVWCYLNTRLWITCSEGMCFLAQSMLVAACGLPFFLSVNGRGQWKRFLAVLLLVLLIPVGGMDNIYTCLYGDGVMGMLAGYVFFMFYMERRTGDRWYRLPMGCGLFLLTLSKELGIAMALLTVLTMAGCAFVLAKKRKSDSAILRDAMACGAVWIFAVATWYIYLAVTSGSTVKTAAVSAGTRLASLGGVTESALAAAAKTAAAGSHMTRAFGFAERLSKFSPEFIRYYTTTFVRNLWVTERAHAGHLIQIPVGVVMTLLLLIIVLRILNTGQGQGAKREEGTYVMVMTFICAILFELPVMYMAYLIMMSREEIMFLGSFDRYLMPCVLMCIFVFAGIYLFERVSADGTDPAGDDARRVRVQALTVLLVMLLWYANPADALILPVERPDDRMFWGIEHAESSFVPGDKVYYVNRTDYDVDDPRKLNYRVFPATSNLKNVQLLTSADRHGVTAEDLEADAMSAQEFSAKLTEKNYTYVYLDRPDEDFIQRYGSLFENPEDIGDGRLYEVTPGAAGLVTLQLRGK